MSSLSGVKTIKIEQHLAVSAKYIDDLDKGILKHLRGLLLLYSQRLGGVPISFGKVQKLHKNAYLLEDQPYLHFDVLVDFEVFQPEVGNVLKAIVNKSGKDYVGCLIQSQFNGSVHKPHHACTGNWIGNKLNLGDEFLFKVLHIFTNYGVVAFKGTIVEHAETTNLEHTDQLNDGEVPSMEFAEYGEGNMHTQNEMALQGNDSREFLLPPGFETPYGHGIINIVPIDESYSSNAPNMCAVTPADETVVNGHSEVMSNSPKKKHKKRKKSSLDKEENELLELSYEPAKKKRKKDKSKVKLEER